jgi:hypothetical protein
MNTNQDSNVVCEITTVNGQVIANNVDASAVPTKTRLEVLLENIDTSAGVRKQLDAAQKKLVEIEESIIVLSQQLADKAETDVKLQNEVFTMVDSLRGLGLEDDLIAFTVAKKFQLSMPTPNRPNGSSEPNSKSPLTPEKVASKMGINESANEEIIAFVAYHKDGVGMSEIIEAFPQYVNGDKTKLAGYVRSLAENSRLVKTGEKRGTKYYAKNS